jgi:hypothetical protein
MNEDIDWSKAPEGATHYNKVFRYFCNKDGWWANAGDFVDEPNQTRWGTDRYIPRPQSWKEGELPPVGIECEAWCKYRGEWEYAKIVHVTKTGGIVYEGVDGDCCQVDPDTKFRPPKSEKSEDAADWDLSIEYKPGDRVIIGGYEAEILAKHGPKRTGR